MDRISLIRRTAPALVGGFLLSLPSAALAEDEVARLNLKPGDWQISKTVEAGDAPRTVTTTACLKNGDPVEHIAGPPCHAEERAIKDGKLTWKIVCEVKNKKAEDVALNGSGELTGEDASFNGSTTFEFDLGEKKVVVKTAWSGKHVGECTKKTGKGEKKAKGDPKKAAKKAPVKDAAK